MRSIVLTADSVSEGDVIPFLSILQDIQKASYLQVGTRDVADVTKSLTPPSAQSTAKRLLSRLKKHNRIIDCLRLCNTCSSPFPCADELHAADYVLGTVTNKHVTIELSQYIGGAIAEALTRTDYTIFDIAEAAVWEQQILVPLLKFARSVVFVDYVAGDKWEENADFATSLNWVLSILRKFGRGDIPKTLFTQAAGGSAPAVQKWCGEHGVRLENRRYRSNAVRSLPHRRLILTDSIGLCIEKGLDLLRGDGTVRPSGVFVVDDPSDHINQCHRADRV